MPIVQTADASRASGPLGPTAEKFPYKGSEISLPSALPLGSQQISLCLKILKSLLNRDFAVSSSHFLLGMPQSLLNFSISNFAPLTKALQQLPRGQARNKC